MESLYLLLFKREKGNIKIGDHVIFGPHYAELYKVMRSYAQKGRSVFADRVGIWFFCVEKLSKPNPVFEVKNLKNSE